jgi:hypothetical protein
VDKAEQIGLNWWKYDPNLTHPAGLVTVPSENLPRRAPATELRTGVAQSKRRISTRSSKKKV